VEAFASRYACALRSFAATRSARPLTAVCAADDGGLEAAAADAQPALSSEPLALLTTLDVAYSDGAAYLQPLLRAAFGRAFPHARLSLRPVCADDGAAGGADDDGTADAKGGPPPPHILVIGALDGGCGRMWDARCRAAAARLIATHAATRSRDEGGGGDATPRAAMLTTVIFVVGEVGAVVIGIERGIGRSGGEQVENRRPATHERVARVVWPCHAISTAHGERW